MSFIAKDLELSQKLTGKVVAGATSSLTMFALKFEDGTGLLLQTAGDPENPLIETTIMPAEELPSIGDAVCKVEWAWIVSSRVESVHSVSGSIKFQLAPAGELAVQANLWKGSPFLSFIPYKGS